MKENVLRCEWFYLRAFVGAHYYCFATTVATISAVDSCSSEAVTRPGLSRTGMRADFSDSLCSAAKTRRTEDEKKLFDLFEQVEMRES